MWQWFEHSWSSVGLGAAVVILVLMFGTDLLRGNVSVSRWRDPVWLSWSLAVAYMLHNFEEYGVDLLGREFHFPATACETFGFAESTTCPLTPAFFVSMNIPIVWVAFIAAALLSKRSRAIGFTGVGVLITNAPSHIATLFTPMGYSPGTLTAIVIFLPLSIWIFATQIGRAKLRVPVLISIIVSAIVVQGILLVLLRGLAEGTVSEGAAIGLQTVSAALVILLPWLAERIWPSINPSTRDLTTSSRRQQ